MSSADIKMMEWKLDVMRKNQTHGARSIDDLVFETTSDDDSLEPRKSEGEQWNKRSTSP